MTWKRDSAELSEKSTTPMKSRFWIQLRESSAALALENRTGLMPPGAVKVVGAAGTGANGSIAGFADGSMNDDGRTWLLPPPDRRSPPAPAAPSRNICLRFNALLPTLCMRSLIRIKRLIADNRYGEFAASIP